ncbi:FMN-dependent dehydrogenase [Teratosphaeria destructans]|uniref:Oxidase FUB9 n=1 Tax=Teratosphaeria destructans TaxID=418781 RepID=A0A9W7SSP0_9PEZI|nr:FMN-dependent dehydrogenase [Teratosphaeria destructans]
MAHNDNAMVLSIAELKAEAAKTLPKAYRGTYLHDNEAAFNRYKLRPRILRNISTIDTSTSIWGCRVAFPFGFAPAALHALAHPDGEVGTSRAAAKHGVAMALSAWATHAVEDVVAQARGNPYAMQICLMKDDTINETIIARAVASGCKAILLTVDAPILGRRFNEKRNKFGLPEGLGFPHLVGKEGEMRWGDNFEYDNSVEWEQALAYIRKRTSLPIWLKGVYTPEDVALAVQYDVAGVIISNHGGRQLDGVPASLDALRDCAPVAKGKIAIALDGGVRRGTDIFKALALGADFVFGGRIPIWGLAYDGQRGVELALQILMAEFRMCMGLAGCRTVQEINKSHLAVLEPSGILAKL